MLFLKQGSHMRRTILIAVLIIVACIFCFLFPIFHSSAAPNYRKSIIPNEFIIYVGSEDSQTEYTVESGGVVSVMVNEEPLVIILPYELSMTDHWWPEKSNKYWYSVAPYSKVVLSLLEQKVGALGCKRS